jgi:hypothetical protein
MMQRWWLANGHWVAEAKREFGERWRLATARDWEALRREDPMRAGEWRAEMERLASLYGASRAPQLWVRDE